MEGLELEELEKQFIEACGDGNIGVAEKLLQNPKINPNCQWGYNNDWTPFNIACFNGYIDIVKLLLNDNRVDINKADNYGFTPFWNACENGHAEIVRLLLNDKRVDINKSGKYDDDDDCGALFFVACRNGHTDTVKLLLNDQRIDINKAHSGATPFWIACREARIEIVKLLLNDQRIDINRTSIDGETPFFVACQTEQIEIVKLLLSDERVDINKADYDGKTPFSIACTFGKTEVVKLLLNDQRVDLNKANYDGETPLCGACLNACVMTFDHGWIEDTPLHVACQNVDIEVLKLLLNDKRISIKKKIKEGKTAMSIAKECNCSEIVKLIKEFDTGNFTKRLNVKMK